MKYAEMELRSVGICVVGFGVLVANKTDIPHAISNNTSVIIPPANIP